MKELKDLCRENIWKLTPYSSARDEYNGKEAHTFLDANDLSGKTVITFCTSGSSGYGRTGEILAALTDESVNWIEGTRFSPSATAQEIEAWLAENGIVPYAAQ